MKKYVLYFRVSTARQGVSGLGLDAQRSVVGAFVDGGVVIGEFTDVESGRKNNRVQLLSALALCKGTGSTLVIAKLDRLSRNVEFIAHLMNSGVDFVACDMPQADKFTVHILAAVAEQEREMISSRTKAALGALKARGVRLGGPNAADTMRENRVKRVYSRPDPDNIDTLRSLRDSGAGRDKLQEVAAKLCGKSVSKVTIWKLLKTV